jgi:cysteine desulfurase
MREEPSIATAIYLDYNASTPIRSEVAATMGELIDDGFGNPSSRHWAGVPAKAAIEKARGQIAAMLGANSDEIVFTSGGSEANNHAIKGAFFARSAKGKHIVASTIEHPATLAPLRFLERLGARITLVPVDRYGRIAPIDVERAIGDDTVLVTIMHANNEVGTIQPLAECARLARRRGVLFHTDAAQSVGKIPILVDDLGCDLLSIAGHKVYAPKGIGALYVRRGIALEPLIHGAGHESGRRAGTESAMLAAALGQACALAEPDPGICVLRDRLWQMLQARFGDRVVRNGHPEHCLPNTLNVAFPGEVGADLLGRLDGVAASTGSACHAGRVTVSPVLAAMGVPERIALGSIRFSLGRPTTLSEIERVTALLAAALS